MIHEYVGNMHLHTPYSDGYPNHDEIALAAIRSEIDFVITTDHNVWVGGLDGYRTLGERRVLLLVGEEIHHQTRDPQKNHLLVYEAQKELSLYSFDPQALIDAVNREGGLAFIAHPVDPEAPVFGQTDLSWVDWDVEGYVGIELWNYMSEFKIHLTSFLRALYYSFKPALIAKSPFPEALRIWDSLLIKGKRVVAIGGADAHAFPVRVGPLKRILFPFEFHFKTVNTHILAEEPLSGDLEIDRQRIYHALRKGHCFIGYDLAAPTKGFRFLGVGDNGQALMGDIVRSAFGVTLQIKLPQRADMRLIHNGTEVARWEDCEAAVYSASQPGAYRVEASIPYKGKMRGWIYSNPIYVNPS